MPSGTSAGRTLCHNSVFAAWRGLRGVVIGSASPCREIVTTDTCRMGCSVAEQDRPVACAGVKCNHLLYMLERHGVHLALKHFLPHLRGKQVLVQSDNTFTVHHINHQVGTKSAQLLEVMRELLT